MDSSKKYFLHGEILSDISNLEIVKAKEIRNTSRYEVILLENGTWLDDHGDGTFSDEKENHWYELEEITETDEENNIIDSIVLGFVQK